MNFTTRSFFLMHFLNSNGRIDALKAANHFGVSERTVRYWWSNGCPKWVDRFCELAERAIPKTDDWDGFRFGRDGRLYTPYKDFSFSGSEILDVWWDRNELSYNRRDVRILTDQLKAFRNDDERGAINEEIDELVRSLQKLKQSPLLALGAEFNSSLAEKQKKKATSMNKK
ncbi:hypothetical protein L2750_12770 [Shewanella submarina]|uniref:Uncharacterized protein n=1 Tax=Shewanella submarina TaxID=2016376 RepID=A0ABV7GDT8_9GAMM|nr:hypothetical protein [Shewanella submarina]MCL1038022.1 hypothetical protein [Shewanella submarina]